MRKYKKLELIEDRIGNLFRTTVGENKQDDYQKFVSGLDDHIDQGMINIDDQNELEANTCDDFFTDFVCAMSKEKIPLVIVANVLTRRLAEIVYFSAEDKRGSLGFLKDLFEFQLKEVLEQNADD